jgi:hypothetical protein
VSADGDDFAFAPDFRFEIDPPFPGDGDWHAEVFTFHVDGSVTADDEERSGRWVAVRVEPTARPAWIGMFAAGGGATHTGVYACADPTKLMVVASGLAYLVASERPRATALIVYSPVTDVVAMPDPALLLLVGFSEIVAVGPLGIAWKSRRLCLDDLVVLSTSPLGIVASGTNLGGTPTLTVDPATGEQTGGTTMADLG